jgi:predicted RNA-binding Zn ribbon-like protein
MSEHEPFAFASSREYICLDFVNTLTDRVALTQLELLNTYEDLVAWGRRADILNDVESAQLLGRAQEQPEKAARWLGAAQQTRELIYQILSAVADSQTPQDKDLQEFNRVLAETMAHTCLAPCEAGFCWTWASDQDMLDRPLWFVVRSAADLLTSPELGCVRVCASEDCGWLFLDTSKNHSRRWCDMKSCGNRAKARRHYERKKVP